MNKSLLVLCLASSIAFAGIDQQSIGQSNNASNGFSNAAVAGQTNTQVNMNSQSSAKYGGGIECPQSTLTIAPYGSQMNMGGATGQTTGIAVGIAIPLGDGGKCLQMAANVERQQRANSSYERIKLCIEMKKNRIVVDKEADPELWATCRSVHIK